MCRPEIRRVLRRAGALVAVLALFFAAAGCGGSSQPATAPATTGTTPSKTVAIWVDVPLGGAAAQEGRQMLDGVRLVVAQAEQRVGDVGIRVRASDDANPATGHSDPVRCEAGAARATADPRAIALIGTYESSCTRLALPALQAAGLALVSPVNGDPGLAAPSLGARGVLLRLAPPDAAEGTAAAAEAKALGRHRIYLLDGFTASADRMRRALVAGARSRQLTIAGSEPAPRTSAGIGEVVTRIRQARADAVWIGAGSGPGIVSLLRALVPAPSASRGDGGPPLVLGSDALYRDGLLRAAGAAAEGLHVITRFVPPEALGGAGADLVDAYARQYGQPGPYMAYAADAARLVLAALRRSDATRAGVLRALRRTRSYNGLIGSVAIGPDGASTLARLAVLRVHDGSFHLERTLDLARS